MIAEAAQRFLTDFDEGVRHAAIEAIAAQLGPAPESDGATLLPVLLNQKEESTRIRGRLAEIFALRGWPVSDDPWLQSHVPIGFKYVEGKLVPR